MTADTTTIIIIVMLTSVGSPTLLAYLTNRHRQAERQQDWDRQDRVAIGADERNRLLAEQLETTRREASRTNTKLDVIHTLVNSAMTSAMTAELDATMRELAMMREVLRIHDAAGRDPSAEAISAIATTQVKVNELKELIAARNKAQHLADVQATAQ